MAVFRNVAVTYSCTAIVVLMIDGTSSKTVPLNFWKCLDIKALKIVIKDPVSGN